MGSIAFILFIIIEPLFKAKLSIHWKRLYLIFVANLFLIPFPGFTFRYKSLLSKLLTSIGLLHDDFLFSTDFTDAFIQITPKGFFMSDIWQYLFTVTGCLIAVFLFFRSYTKYRKFKQYCSKKSILRTISIKYKKDIQVYQCDIVSTPCVVGFIRPIILIPAKDWKENELSLILEHELAHIAHHDNFWKLVFALIIILHFYNPLSYLLLFIWDRISELYCDQTVVNQKSASEIELYGTLMIDLSSTSSFTEKSWPIAGLNKNKYILKERIISMKHYNKTNILLGSVLFILCIFLSSLPVLAYEPKQLIFSNDSFDCLEVSSENVKSINHDFTFESDKLTVITLDGSTIYVDDTDSNVSPATICFHDYEPCTIRKHFSYSDGSCKIEEYSGEKCKYCNKIVFNELINTYTQTKCTHK